MTETESSGQFKAVHELMHEMVAKEPKNVVFDHRRHTAKGLGPGKECMV